MLTKLLLTLYFLLTLSLVGCNHLLYPADRNPFVIQNSIKPVPRDIYIPVYKETKEPFLHTWYFPSQSKITKGLVIHFHGNGQNLTTHFLFMHWITDYGYDYLIFDYRGYGASSEKSATQKKTIEDGLAVFRYLNETFHGLPIIALGQSLGANVLLRTLQEMNQKQLKNQLPSLVVFDSSFLSYHQAAKSLLSQKWFLYPLKPLVPIFLSDEWSAYNLINYSPAIPALFFHGTNDLTIDYELGVQNFTHWPGSKVFISQKDGAHTSAFGDNRFLDSRPIFLKCVDYAISKKNSFEDCGR